jgi:hypothetical protein
MIFRIVNLELFVIGKIIIFRFVYFFDLLKNACQIFKIYFNLKHNETAI